MKRLLLILIVLPVFVSPAQAGILFGKKGKKPAPNERVPQLLTLLRTDGDEKKRAQAAEELRQYDPRAFPDVVPVLIEVLHKDKRPAVRAEAAQTLGKLRPVSPQVGQALENAVAKDGSMRVRLQARSALLQYHWAGYRGGHKEELLTGQTKEPPLADAGPAPDGTPPAVTTQPLAPPLKPQPAPGLFRRAPRSVPAPVQTPEPPLAPAAPASPPANGGPDLTPPGE